MVGKFIHEIRLIDLDVWTYWIPYNKSVIFIFLGNSRDHAVAITSR